MLHKIIFYSFFVGFFLTGVFFFGFAPSYQKSLEARVDYFMGNYKKAYELSSQAYELDKYNRMAFTVMTQSKISMDYKNYITLGIEYLEKIEKISSMEKINPSDMARIKMMCEVMMDSFEKLSPTKMTDKILLDETKVVYEKFKKLYEKLFEI